MGNTYHGKKILVLGGASQHCKVVETAKELGIKTYVADFLVDSPAKQIADVPLMINVMDVQALIDVCRSENIDGAIATSLDVCQIPYQQLCEKMEYPCFGNADQYRKLTNKQAFKECCTYYGVDTIPSYEIEDIWADEIVEYPIFIKPVDSRGSRGQTICYNKEQALKAIEYARKYSSDDSVVIEKYMEGCQDFTVSYLFADGKATTVRTGDRFGGSVGSGLENLCVASCSPSKFTDEYMEKVNGHVLKMLYGIGIKNGPVFFQGFIDGNKVCFYDPGLRFAGGEYERILKETTGIDIIKLLVEYAITGNAIICDIDSSIYKLNGKKLTQLDPTLSPGIVDVIEGVEEIKALPCVHSFLQRIKVGETITKTNDLRQRFGEICIVSNNTSEEITNIQKIQDSLKVVSTDGENMIFDAFDANKLM